MTTVSFFHADLLLHRMITPHPRAKSFKVLPVLPVFSPTVLDLLFCCRPTPYDPLGQTARAL
jgi:hypothetical protein